MVRLPRLFDPIAKEDPAGYAKGVLKNRFTKGLEVAIGDRKYDPMVGERDYGLLPWQSSAQKFGEPDTKPLQDPVAETAAYGAGRLAGSFANDSFRSWFWRFNHPLAIASSVGREIPKQAGLVDRTGKASPLAATLAGFGVATALDLGSGNTDITNLDEGGRPKGYAALFASPEDPTKSTNLAVEIPVGYVTGRKGKLLPYEDFVKERPDVAPEEYEAYKQYQGFNTPGLFGIETLDPSLTAATGAALNTVPDFLRKEPNNQPKSLGRLARKGAVGAVIGSLVPATADLVSRMGILKGTWDNLEDQPEAQLLGYKVPLTGTLIAGGVGAGIYGLQKRKANQIAEAAKTEERNAEIARRQNELRQAEQITQTRTPILNELGSMSPQASLLVAREIDKEYRTARRNLENKIQNYPSAKKKEALFQFEDNPLGWVDGLDPDIQRRIVEDSRRKAGRELNWSKDVVSRPITLMPEDQDRYDRFMSDWKKKTGAYVPPDVPDFL